MALAPPSASSGQRGPSRVQTCTSVFADWILSTARVLFEYVKDEDNEMALEEGEVLEQVEMIDEGWWSAVGPGGKNGLFPCASFFSLSSLVDQALTLILQPTTSSSSRTTRRLPQVSGRSGPRFRSEITDGSSHQLRHLLRLRPHLPHPLPHQLRPPPRPAPRHPSPSPSPRQQA